MPDNCPTCKGAGMVHAGDTTAFQPTVVSCPECRGTGIHNANRGMCLYFDGTGTIPDPPAEAQGFDAEAVLARAEGLFASYRGSKAFSEVYTDLRAAVAEIERLRGRVVDEEEYSGRLQDLRDSLRVELAAALKRAEEAEDDVRAWREEGRLLVDRACTAERAIADVTRERNEALRELERRGPECECRNRPCDDIACPYKAGCH